RRRWTIFGHVWIKTVQEATPGGDCRNPNSISRTGRMSRRRTASGLERREGAIESLSAQVMLSTNREQGCALYRRRRGDHGGNHDQRSGGHGGSRPDAVGCGAFGGDRHSDFVPSSGPLASGIVPAVP